MAKSVTTIPATISKYTAKPINSKRNAEWQDMPVSARTWKTNKQATLPSVIITPTTFRAVRTGSSYPCIRTKESVQHQPHIVMVSIE